MDGRFGKKWEVHVLLASYVQYTSIFTLAGGHWVLSFLKGTVHLTCTYLKAEPLAC